MSFCGFQSLSYIMTVSAVARFRPNLPARVDRRKQNEVEEGPLNRSRLACLSDVFTEPEVVRELGYQVFGGATVPSRRSYFHPLN